VHPFVCHWWAIDGDGRLYRYREIYMTGRLVEDHAREMRRLSAGEPDPIAVVTDHDAEDRATLERHLGMSTTAAIKTVKPGIQAVQSRLRPQADGRPRLFLIRDARVERDQTLADKHLPTCTEEEFDGYVWDPRREVPVKENDHGMDGVRYGCIYFDDGSAGFETVPDELADALSYFGV
jgi:phage terminase large subunit